MSSLVTKAREVLYYILQSGENVKLLRSLVSQAILS